MTSGCFYKPHHLTPSYFGYSWTGRNHLEPMNHRLSKCLPEIVSVVSLIPNCCSLNDTCQRLCIGYLWILIENGGAIDNCQIKWNNTEKAIEKHFLHSQFKEIISSQILVLGLKYEKAERSWRRNPGSFLKKCISIHCPMCIHWRKGRVKIHMPYMLLWSRLRAGYFHQ